MGIFSKKNPSGSKSPLIFKNEEAAYEYACKYLTCKLEEGSMLPAYVLDPKEAFGSDKPIHVDDEGRQIPIVAVAADDGGFLCFRALTSWTGKPMLKPGQLVAWQAVSYASEIADNLPDKRSAWVGLITAVLKPEFINGKGWAVREDFRA